MSKKSRSIRTQRPLSVWVESAVLALLVPFIGAWISRRDPLFVRGPFPWQVVAPLIAGVRYGFAAGFGCAALIVFIMLGAWEGVLPLQFPSEEFPAQLSVGLLIVGMLAGEFCDLWKRRLQSLETEQLQLQRRFDGFARTYQALRVSHDLLESRVAGATSTVREGLRALAETSLPHVDAAASAQRILDLFASSCDVRIAAVYLCAEGDTLPETPTASLGEVVTKLHHPLIEEALRRRAVASATPSLQGGDVEGDLLIAAPFIDLDDRLRGLLVVRDMPFMAFDDEMLRRIAVLAGRIGDLLGADRDVRGDDHAAVAAFTRDVRRALRDRRTHGLVAGVVRFGVPARADVAVTQVLCGERRTTDRALATGAAEGGSTVTVLLPLTDEVGIARYLERIEAQLQARTGVSLADSGVQIVYRASVDDSTGGRVLRDLQPPPLPPAGPQAVPQAKDDDARA
jgi:polysaccharide biosynthesis protein PelD